jgi:hypothetical protein
MFDEMFSTWTENVRNFGPFCAATGAGTGSQTHRLQEKNIKETFSRNFASDFYIKQLQSSFLSLKSQSCCRTSTPVTKSSTSQTFFIEGYSK